MKQKRPDEFEAFDQVMDGLLAVPYSELQKKLEEEKKAKAKQKEKRAISSPASRVSDSKKKS
jgi:inner membrane protein involved in colicin E2 resistance